MKKIRILFIVPRDVLGGAESQLYNLIKSINKNKFKVWVGLLYPDKNLKRFSAIKSMELVNFNKRSKMDISVFFKIWFFLRKNRIDIIQTFLGNHHAYIPALFNKRVYPVGGIRSTNKKTELNICTKFIRFTLDKLSANSKKILLISNSHCGKQRYLDYGFISESIKVIPNGINTKLFSSGRRLHKLRGKNLNKNTVLGMIARVIPKKNQEGLINMFSRVHKKFPDTLLLIVGGGPNIGKLKLRAEKMGVKGSVIFTGPRNDIPDLLKTMDIFLFPSKFPEGWPNAVGEAMAAGLPVVAYDVGDVKRIISHGKDGFVTPKDSPKFEQFVETLLTDKKLRLKIGKNAKNKIRSKFGVENMVSKYERLYQNIKK